MRPLALSLLLASLLLAPSARAQTSRCDALSPAKKAFATQLFERLHPYDCCDETLAVCLKATPRCALAGRLADDVCRLIEAGKDEAFVTRALDKRAQSMVELGPKASIALDEELSAGDPAAPVQLAVYACPRCPFCSKLLPELYREVTEGSLKGKVRLWLRPYPLKSHPGSTEASLALLAAAKHGKAWPFLLRVYARFDHFDPAQLSEIAGESGLDSKAFGEALADPGLRETLIESKKEGLRNKITATPALFIDGRRYSYELEMEVLQDVLAEEAERLAAPPAP